SAKGPWQAGQPAVFQTGRPALIFDSILASSCAKAVVAQASTQPAASRPNLDRASLDRTAGRKVMVVSVPLFILLSRVALTRLRRSPIDLEPGRALELILGHAVLVGIDSILPGFVVVPRLDPRELSVVAALADLLDEQVLDRPLAFGRRQIGADHVGAG